MRYVEKTLNGMLDRLTSIYQRDINMAKTKYMVDKKYYTLESYLNYFGADVSSRVRGILGMRLTAICKRAGIMTFKEKSESFNSFKNSYPTYLMRKVVMASFGNEEAWIDEMFVNMELNEFLVKFFDENKDMVALNKKILFKTTNYFART
jgi:hypothetical protein